MEVLITKFLSMSFGFGGGDGSGHGSDYCKGYGNGDASGDGTDYGYGCGKGYADGDGNEYGLGDGTGSGDGRGYGDGDCCEYCGEGDVVEFNHQKVYLIDKFETLIDSVHGNYAKGKILQKDLTLKECYIAKCGNYFAHGETLKQAMSDAQTKYEEMRPLDERIADFIKQYPTLDTVATHADLYKWHNILTGSCTMGRNEFANNHNLSTTEGTMTIKDFLNLTKNAYGGNIIKQVLQAYTEKDC